MKTIEKSTRILLMIFCLICVSIISYLNILEFEKNKMFIFIIPLILVCIFIALFVRLFKANTLFFSIFLFVMAFTLKAVIAMLYNTPPESDFNNFYNAALKAAQGDYSFSTYGYFKVWAYQTGIVAFYALLIKLGCNLLALKIINCGFIAATNVLIYLIARKFANEKYSRFISLLYLVYPAPYFLCSVLTNQHLSNFLLLLGLYVFINRKTNVLRNIITSAVLIAFGNAVRPQGIIIVASILVFGLLEVLSNLKDKSNNAKFALLLTCFLGIYFILGYGLSAATRISGLNENGLNNTFPLYKFVVGLNNETFGTYSEKDVDILMPIEDDDLRDQISIAMISQRLSDHRKLFKLINEKNKKMWVQLDGSFEFGFGYLRQSAVDIVFRQVSYEKFRDILKKLEKVIYTFVFLLAATGLFAALKRKKCINEFIMILFIVLFNFAIYCLIEIQPRYRDFQVIFVFILASTGLEPIQSLYTRVTSPK